MKRWALIGLFLLCFRLLALADELDRLVTVEMSKGSVYELLSHISERSGILFIYEKGVVNNNKRTKISAGTYMLRDAILQVTGEKELQMRVIGTHILLSKGLAESLVQNNTIQGYVKDRRTNEAIPYCSVSFEATGSGTVTNLDGRFAIKITDSIAQANVSFSHLGYRSCTVPIELFSEVKPEIFLDPIAVQLQEVVVRYVPAQKIIREMLENQAKNYSKEPAIVTSFYREGVEVDNLFASFTEGVCQIYKWGVGSLQEDQVKLLKMRHLHNLRYPDSILVKIQAGVRASLLLDIVRHTPDFFAPDRDQYFTFTRVGMERTDSCLAHIIAFEQRETVIEPLYTGLLYIDSENMALLKAEFEISPLYIKQMGTNVVVKKSKNIDVEVKKMSYSISYRKWNGVYWINHVRGDIQLKIKKKKNLFQSSKSMNAFFEMATCDIDTKNVVSFPNRERLSTGKVFSLIKFDYDADFWERFNTIVPETKITEAIAKLLLNVEVQE
ncbi:MAG: carboxypeptidase-like regulatory domain-containing protein [Prevotellaceae bacterium]|nr:carboxypeptidase-like regulatory domain-containing protein [Prevotellaceae bacterium]